jgi:hypothetical protein
MIRVLRFADHPLAQRFWVSWRSLFPTYVERGGERVRYFQQREFLHVETYGLHRSRHAAVGVDFDPHGEMGPEVMFRLCIPFLFSLYVTILCPLVRRVFDDHREIGVMFLDGAIWLHPLSSVGNWESRWPWWRKGVSWRYLDTLFGRYQHRAVVTKPRFVGARRIAAGAGFPAELRRLRCVVEVHEHWRRYWPWWPFHSRVVRTDISTEDGKGVSHPGKGTCGYNCGDDGLYSESTCHEDACPDDVLASRAVRRSVARAGFDRFVDAVAKYRKEYPL